MPRDPLAKALRPFSASGYEILDEELESHGEVAIWSIDPLTPKLGDLFTIERDGSICEVAVVELATFTRGWSAVCRLSEDR